LGTETLASSPVRSEWEEEGAETLSHGQMNASLLQNALSAQVGGTLRITHMLHHNWHYSNLFIYDVFKPKLVR
jgi:hypothetical protein